MTSKARVLVVDDDPDILEAVSDVLENEGYDVDRARQGAEALERVAARRPAVILLDLMMPVMDGPSFATELDRRGFHIPIVVISAEGNARRASALGARAFLAKPFDLEALLAEVERQAAPVAAGGGAE